MKDRNEAQTKTFEVLYGGKPGGGMADFAELELRTLAAMRKDAEGMDDTDTFKRPGDIREVSTGKLKLLLTLREAESILVEGVVNPVDFHESKAAELFSCKPEAVTEDMRRFAKCYNFAELYGNPFPSVQARIDRDLEKLRATVG